MHPWPVRLVTGCGCVMRRAFVMQMLDVKVLSVRVLGSGDAIYFRNAARVYLPGLLRAVLMVYIRRFTIMYGDYYKY